MRTILFLWMINLVTLAANGQENNYVTAMQKTIAALDYASGQQDYINCGIQFERIAVAEKTRWMPYYYAAYSIIIPSFDEPDGERKDLLLDRAQEMLDEALKLAPDESELYVLQAFLYPSRIMVDPMVRGMEYIEKCFSALEKAKALNPDNPRAYFLEAMNKLNMPASFGGGPEVAKPIFLMADEKFRAFQNEDPLWPGWGEDANRTELEKLN